MLIEHRTFVLAPGAQVEAFLAADRRVQTEVVPFQPGFVRRTTARGHDGRWLIETFWFDGDSCDRAGHVAHQAVDQLAACMDVDSLRVERWNTLE